MEKIIVGKRYVVTKASDDRTFNVGDHISMDAGGSINNHEADIDQGRERALSGSVTMKFSTERLRELSRSVAPSEMHRACSWSANEIERLRGALKKANDQTEQFERKWYLRGDAIEKLKQWAAAYPVELFPEMTKEDWQRADEVLSAAGLSLTRMSASNIRHVITQAKKIVDESISA